MHKMFVLIRKDLPSTYRGVQGGHALAEFLLRHPVQGQEWNNHTLIYLGIENQASLEEWSQKLTEKGIIHVGFREPDIGNELTAIATYGNEEEYKCLRLL